jgi:hypothetical protein
VRPTGTAAGPPTATREFSTETMGELLRALRARAAVIAQMADVFEILARPDRPGVVVRMHFNLAGKPETYR